MEESTKLLKLRLNMIKFDSNYGKTGTCKLCQKVEVTMEHMLECKEAKKRIGGITGSETIMSENKEELMAIYNYMEIVKQGTIFGPKLCSVATEKINGIGEEISTHITPELTIGAPVYVDDILGIGDCKTVEKVIRNSRRLEEDKKN